MFSASTDTFEGRFLTSNDLDIKDDYVVIGVSGGVDSMVLLSIIKNQLSSKIVCAHVHHNLRFESDFELEFVRDYCLKNNIIVIKIQFVFCYVTRVK